jgi:hypothetical protein
LATCSAFSHDRFTKGNRMNKTLAQIIEEEHHRTPWTPRFTRTVFDGPEEIEVDLFEAEEKNMTDVQFFAHEERQVAIYGADYCGGDL